MQSSPMAWLESSERSTSLGDAETQTPRKHTQDQSSQADVHYPSGMHKRMQYRNTDCVDFNPVPL